MLAQLYTNVLEAFANEDHHIEECLSQRFPLVSGFLQIFLDDFFLLFLLVSPILALFRQFVVNENLVLVGIGNHQFSQIIRHELVKFEGQ